MTITTSSSIRVKPLLRVKVTRDLFIPKGCNRVVGQSGFGHVEVTGKQFIQVTATDE